MTRDILFIHPSKKAIFKEDNLFTNESLSPSLGLGLLSSACRQNNFVPKIIDLRLKDKSLAEVLSFIEEHKPLFVGITAFTGEIVQAAFIAKAIKKIYPDTPIVIGGPHVSAMPQGTLFEFDSFDYAVIGEGEKTIVALANTLSAGIKELSSIAGIAYRTQGRIMVNSPGELINDLDSLGFPAWDIFDLKLYHDVFVISASRGCPYKCYFCNPNYLGEKVRIRDPFKVVDEIEYLVNKFGAKKIQFVDAALSILGENVIVMCDEIIKRGLHKKIIWDCEARADALNRKIIDRMMRSGCHWIALGVETGSDELLKNVINKKETKLQIKQAVAMIKFAGIKARCFFILGHLGETYATIKETIKFALELNPDALSFGLMVPNPGTEIRKIAQSKNSGLKILNNNWEHYNQFDFDCFELEGLPLLELKKMRSQAYFKFYLHHPIKAISLFFDSSGYNYRISNIFKILGLLIKNMRRV